MDRTARRLGALGLFVAVVALGLGVRAALAPQTTAAACRTVAWDAVPAASALPGGWSIADSAFTGTGITSTLSGPAPADGSNGSTTIFATVDCFGNDASDIVARSRAAATAAGQRVATISGLGDEAYSTTDTASGAMAIHFRRGELVAYTAAVSATAASDLRAVAAAFDDAMKVALAGGTALAPGPSAAGPSTGPASSAGVLAGPSSSEAALASPRPSGAAPELEALLPSSVAGTVLTRDSAVGVDALGTNQQVQGLGAALRSMGVDPTQLHVAIAYDGSGGIDLSMLAFGMAGTTVGKLESTILTAWLQAEVPGVKTTTVTLSSHTTTAVDYGDKGSISYLLVIGDAVVLIETADQALAAQAAAALG